MKRAILMLVFLGMWSVALPSLHASVATAGDQEVVSDDASAGGDDVVTTFGATDDGSDGDPGAAGDGYGFAEDKTGLEGCEDGTLWDEFLLFLAQLQMDLLP